MSVETPVKPKVLFKSPQRSWFYIFPDGTKAVFSGGIYFTDDEEKIAHLLSEIKKGHQLMYVDPNEPEVTLDRTDPIAALRQRIASEERARLMEEMKAATDPSRDMGTSTQEKLRAMSTSDILAVTANGDAAARVSGKK